jgi:hypothetical protein
MGAISIWKQSGAVVLNYDSIWIGNRKVNDIFFKIGNLTWEAKRNFPKKEPESRKAEIAKKEKEEKIIHRKEYYNFPNILKKI